MEVVSIATDLIQAGAVAVAAWVGARSLNAWRRQLVGSKRLDLAEDALVAAHEVNDAIRMVRNAVAFWEEGATRRPEKGETEEQARMRNTYFVPIERLRTVSVQFEKLRELKTRCRVHFGDAVSQYFDKLTASEIRIASASRMLIQTYDAQPPRTQEQAEQNQQQVKKWQSIIWDHGTMEAPDDFSEGLIGALVGLEKILKPHLKDN